MSTANLRWSFSITNVRRSTIGLIAISGIARSPEGETHKFVATNGMDPRYPERFKVNWNGVNRRMPVPTGHGIPSEVMEATDGVDGALLMGRGPRVAIARMARLMVQNGEV